MSTCVTYLVIIWTSLSFKTGFYSLKQLKHCYPTTHTGWWGIADPCRLPCQCTRISGCRLSPLETSDKRKDVCVCKLLVPFSPCIINPTAIFWTPRKLELFPPVQHCELPSFWKQFSFYLKVWKIRFLLYLYCPPDGMLDIYCSITPSMKFASIHF